MERKDSNALHSLFSNILNVTLPQSARHTKRKAIRNQGKTDASTPRLPCYPLILLIQKTFTNARLPNLLYHQWMKNLSNNFIEFQTRFKKEAIEWLATAWVSLAFITLLGNSNHATDFFFIHNFGAKGKLFQHTLRLNFTKYLKTVRKLLNEHVLQSGNFLLLFYLQY